MTSRQLSSGYTAAIHRRVGFHFICGRNEKNRRQFSDRASNRAFDVDPSEIETADVALVENSFLSPTSHFCIEAAADCYFILYVIDFSFTFLHLFASGRPVWLSIFFLLSASCSTPSETRTFVKLPPLDLFHFPPLLVGHSGDIPDFIPFRTSHSSTVFHNIPPTARELACDHAFFCVSIPYTRPQQSVLLLGI